MRTQTGKHKDARANDRADSQCRQLKGTERALQAMPAFLLSFREQHAHRFSCKQGVAHATPPLGFFPGFPVFPGCVQFGLKHCRAQHAAPLQEYLLIPCLRLALPAVTTTGKPERPEARSAVRARRSASYRAREQT